MKTIRYRSGMPYILAGLVVLLYALLFGLGSPLGYAGALLLAYLAYSPLTRLFPDRYAVVEDMPKAKDKASDALIQECAPYLRAVRAAGDVIYDPWLLEKVDVIAIGYRSLLRALSEDAGLKEPLGAYLRYLLPNTVMLLNVRVKLQERQLDADKVNTRKRIDEALIAIEQSLDRELKLIEQGEPLQVQQDILQMKTMLGQTGILQTEEAVPTDAEFLASIPERTPEELIAEQMGAQREHLLQVLRQRVAAMEPQVRKPFAGAEEPSVYAASAAAPAEALVVPVAPELPDVQAQPEEPLPQPTGAAQQEDLQAWFPHLSQLMDAGWVEPAGAEAVQAGEGADIQAARARLIELLDDMVLKLEREARQEQAGQPAQDDDAPAAEPLAVDALIAGAQEAFLREDARMAEKWYRPVREEMDGAEGETPAPRAEEAEPEPSGAQQPALPAADNIISAWWSHPSTTGDEAREATDDAANVPGAASSLWAVAGEGTDVPFSIPEEASDRQPEESNAQNIEQTREQTIEEGIEEGIEAAAAEPVAEAEAPQEVFAESPPEASAWADEVERLRAEQGQQDVAYEWPSSADAVQPAALSAPEAAAIEPLADASADAEPAGPAAAADAAQAAEAHAHTPQEPAADEETQREAPAAEAEPLLAALPQAGAWFSLEGFEDEDDLPLYTVAKPFVWVPPATSPRTAFLRAGGGQQAGAWADAPVSGPERTDVPSVMESPEFPWLNAPVLQEEQPARHLADALQQAVAAVQEKLQKRETDRLSGRSYLEEIGKQFSVEMGQPQPDLPSGESAFTTFQAVPSQGTRAQRGRMTSQQIEEMVLGDILRGQGMKDFEWQETNQELTGRKRKPRMEIDKSVLMALLGHDSATYLH